MRRLLRAALPARPARAVGGTFTWTQGVSLQPPLELLLMVVAVDEAPVQIRVIEAVGANALRHCLTAAGACSFRREARPFGRVAVCRCEQRDQVWSIPQHNAVGVGQLFGSPREGGVRYDHRLRALVHAFGGKRFPNSGQTDLGGPTLCLNDRSR